MKSTAMRKIPLFSAVLSLFLLVPASIIWAQVTKTLNGTVRYESGMSTSTFETPKGNVSVVLPQSLCGATITGTVSVEPSGKTEKEKSRNLKDLLQYVVMLDGQKIPLSGSPAKFDWLTHMDRPSRTPMELLNVSGTKVAELSLPPVLKAPSYFGGWQSDGGPVLGTPSKVLVKGDKLNVYTDRPISPGVKFVLTDPKGQELFVQPLCQSSNQVVLTIPDGVMPGYCKIRMEEIEVTIEAKPGNKTNSIGFQLMDISLTSPNTNLRPGQTSYVLADVKTGTGPGWQGPLPDVWFGSIRVDLRNLNPNTVTMEGGNLQRVNINYFKKTLTSGEQTYLEFQLQRNITGNAVGSFSVSATLHEDYNSSTDPFRPQLNVLKTPEDFNAWANALKKDLKEYAAIQKNDNSSTDPLQKDIVLSSIANAQRAIDNMPVCTDPGQLDECKAVTYSLLQPLHVPKGAAIIWSSSYEALKAATRSMDGGGDRLIDFDVIRNGIEFINRTAVQLKDASLQEQCNNTQRLFIKPVGETMDEHYKLKSNLGDLLSAADKKIGTQFHSDFKYELNDLKFASYLLPSLAQQGRVHPYTDMAATLDPIKKELLVIPEYRSGILDKLGATPLNNGQFRINSFTRENKPITYVVTEVPVDQVSLIKWVINNDPPKDIQFEVQEESKYKDFDAEFTDSTGTKCHFFKDAICDKTFLAPYKNEKCVPHDKFEYDTKTGKGKFVPDGKYCTTECFGRPICIKGDSFCVEMYLLISLTYIYEDKNCTRLVDVEKFYNYTCK